MDNSRRKFLRTAGVAAAAAGSVIAAPHVKAQSAIKWRFQTYAGPALADHVIKPAIDAFNKAANGAMEIELYTSDQLVPTAELFRTTKVTNQSRNNNAEPFSSLACSSIAPCSN